MDILIPPKNDDQDRYLVEALTIEGIMNPKAKGEISEAIIIAELIKTGFSVSTPFGNNQRYDLIIDVNGDLIRAQCKTGRPRGNNIEFSSSSCNGFTGKKKTYSGQIECFLICYNNEVFVVSINDVPGPITCLSLLPKAPRRSCLRASDHRLSANTVFRKCFRQVIPKKIKSDNPNYKHKVIEWPADEVLKELVWKGGATKAAATIGISNSAVKKRCRSRGIDTPPRGYFTKLKHAAARMRK